MWFGYNLLLMGWLGIVSFTLAWYANPLIATISLWWPRVTAETRLNLSLFIPLLSSTTYVITYLGGIPFDDGRHPIERFMVGYYLWQVTCVAPLALAVWCLYDAKRTEEDVHRAL